MPVLSHLLAPSEALSYDSVCWRQEADSSQLWDLSSGKSSGIARGQQDITDSALLKLKQCHTLAEEQLFEEQLL